MDTVKWTQVDDKEASALQLEYPKPKFCYVTVQYISGVPVAARERDFFSCSVLSLSWGGLRSRKRFLGVILMTSAVTV
jgi:hypothetical protein